MSFGDLLKTKKLTQDHSVKNVQRTSGLSKIFGSITELDCMSMRLFTNPKMAVVPVVEFMNQVLKGTYMSTMIMKRELLEVFCVLNVIRGLVISNTQ